MGYSGACNVTALMKNKPSGSSRHTDVNFPQKLGRILSFLSGEATHWYFRFATLGSSGSPPEESPEPGAPPGAGGLQRHP